MGKHIITSAWWFGLIALSLCLVNPSAAQVDQQRAEAYFKEAATICQRDGGRLWGVSLCGPMVFADVRTRTLATNQPRPAGEGPWQRFLRKWAILNDGLHANASHKMSTHLKSKTCRNAVDHKPLSIKVEFDKLITAHRNSGVVGAILYVLSDQ